MCVVWGNVIVWLTDKVIPPLIAALVAAYLLARLLENHRARRDFLSKEVEEIRQTLHRFWDVCCDYWLPATLANQMELEERISLMQDEILASVQILGSNFGPKFQEDTTLILVELALEATGGRFRDPQRQADHARVGRLRSVVVKLRQQLQSARRESLRRAGK